MHKRIEEEFVPDDLSLIDYDDEEEEEIDYDGYMLFDIEITETAVKKIAVSAKSAKSAKRYVEDVIVDPIAPLQDIDEYKKTVTVCESCGSTVPDITVPEWFD